MSQTVTLEVTRTFTVVVDMEEVRIASVESLGDTASAVFIPGSAGEAAAIEVLKRDRRFRVRET